MSQPQVPAIGRATGLLFSALIAIALVAVLPHPQRPVQLSTPSFLTRLLGDPAPASSEPLRVAPGASVTFPAGTVAVSSRQGHVSLSLSGAGSAAWHRFANGTSRQTPFGLQTVTVSPNQAEESLVVGSHQGPRTWTWQLDTGALVPRIGNDGTVGFLDGRTLADVYIKPVAILDAARRDITPAGLRWSVVGRSGSWWLELKLDDSRLPTPYVIDPGIVIRSAQGSNTGGVATTSVVLTMPAGVALNDFLVAQVTFTNSGGTLITAPAGWTLIRRDDASTISQALYSRVASGTEPPSYTWTIDSSQNASGGIVAYTGVDASSPIDDQSVAVDTSGVSLAVTAPAVTTTVANDILVGFFGIDAGATFTPPSGMTKNGTPTPRGRRPRNPPRCFRRPRAQAVSRPRRPTRRRTGSPS